jgi:hypothetical protein
VFPLRDAPPKEPLSNSGYKVRAHVPEAVDVDPFVDFTVVVVVFVPAVVVALPATVVEVAIPAARVRFV